ncbi:MULTISPECIES: MFS transporter [Methylobacterium]|uniref:MFS transporter n=1 Tax=Methylobacterium TaxID=407 RepID=UPI00272DE66B|nr:MFS transporter [Methylobacterium sp.]
MTIPREPTVTPPPVTLPSAAWDRRARLTAGVLGLGAFLTQFDVTALVVVMPEIGRDLGLGMPGLAWVIDAYSLAFTAALLAAGALADRHGRRLALLLGNALFAAASVACALASTAPSLCVARAAQGIGAAFLITGAIASIAGSFPDPALRARALALTGILSGVAMALGPTLGGLLAARLGWPAIFLANILPCGVIALAVPRFVGEERRGGGRPIDWPGLLVLIAALGLAVEGVLQVHAAPTAGLAGGAASVALTVAFACRQRRREHPLIDSALVSDRGVLAVVVLLLPVSAGYWAVLTSLPAFLMAAHGLGPQEAGVALLAAALPMLVLPPVGSRMVGHLGWRRTFGTALTLIAVGNAILAGAAGASAMAGAFAGMTALGAGAALAHSQLTGAVVALAPPGSTGMASAVTMVARQAGFALGVAGLGVLTPTTGGAGYAAVFAVAAIAGLIGLGACLALPNSPNRPR